MQVSETQHPLPSLWTSALSSGYTRLFLEQWKYAQGLNYSAVPCLYVSMPVIQRWNVCGLHLVTDSASKENLTIIIDLHATAQSYLLTLPLALWLRIQITGIKLREWAVALSTFCSFYQGQLNIFIESYFKRLLLKLKLNILQKRVNAGCSTWHKSRKTNWCCHGIRVWVKHPSLMEARAALWKARSSNHERNSTANFILLFLPIHTPLLFLNIKETSSSTENNRKVVMPCTGLPFQNCPLLFPEATCSCISSHAIGQDTHKIC